MTTFGNVRRIQRKRTRGWRTPPFAVYVGRPTVWGNPFRVKDRTIAGHMAAKNRYRAALLAGDLHITPEIVRAKLKGKDLTCWCRLAYPCHADVLLEIANS